MRALVPPGRAQKYFCQNFESVTIPEAPGRFLKKSENENSWKSGPKVFRPATRLEGFSGISMLAL